MLQHTVFFMAQGLFLFIFVKRQCPKMYFENSPRTVVITWKMSDNMMGKVQMYKIREIKKKLHFENKTFNKNCHKSSQKVKRQHKQNIFELFLVFLTDY